MRLLAITVALLGVLVACDGGGASFQPDTGLSTGDSGLGTGTPPGNEDVTSKAMGTQVGSEGFWGCPIISIEPVLDRTSANPLLGGAPVELSAARLGIWPLQITDTDASDTVPGSMFIADGGEYFWVDVEEGTDCYDHLVVSTIGTLSREEFPSETLSGWLAIREGASRLVVTSGASLAVTSSAWGMPSSASPVTFRIDADLDQSFLDGAAMYVDCETTELACPTSELVASIHSER